MASATKIVTDRLPDHLPDLSDLPVNVSDMSRRARKSARRVARQAPDFQAGLNDVSRRARKAAKNAQKAAAQAQKSARRAAGRNRRRSVSKRALPVLAVVGVAAFLVTRSRRSSSAGAGADRPSEAFTRT